MTYYEFLDYTIKRDADGLYAINKYSGRADKKRFAKFEDIVLYLRDISKPIHCPNCDDDLGKYNGNGDWQELILNCENCTYSIEWRTNMIRDIPTFGWYDY